MGPRRALRATLPLCLLTGLLFLLDGLFFTGPDGFSTLGGAFWRYALLAAMLAWIWRARRQAEGPLPEPEAGATEAAKSPADARGKAAGGPAGGAAEGPADETGPRWALTVAPPGGPAVLCLGLCAAACLAEAYSGLQGAFGGLKLPAALTLAERWMLARAGLLAAAALWCGWRALRGLQRRPLPAGGALLGVLAVAGYFVLCVERFVAYPASVQRVAPTLRVLDGVVAMLFFCALLRAVHLPPEPGLGRRVWALGSLVFLFSFCLPVAAELCSLLRGGATGLGAGALPTLCAGLLGGALALRCQRRRPQPYSLAEPGSSPEPDSSASPDSSPEPGSSAGPADPAAPAGRAEGEKGGGGHL